MKTGLLARRGDVRELAQSIIWMMEHDEERRQMGKCARELAVRDYEFDIQPRRYMELYHELYRTS